jgi:hypothetical protein
MAVVAILLNGFAPLISHAIAAKKSAIWLELCTVAGIERVSMADGRDAAGIDASSVHCPYCIPHGASFGLAPPLPLSVPMAVGSPVAVAAVDSVSRSPSRWAASQPRAPPPAH